MTRDETKEILMTIQATYPNFKPEDKTITINTWFTLLKDYDRKQIGVALRDFITHDASGFAPSIGQLTTRVEEIFGKDNEMNELEAWEVVLKAIQNSGSNSQEEFYKLPTLIQKAVVSPRQLREWALDEQWEKHSPFYQNGFMRQYRTEKGKFENRNILDCKNQIESKNQTLLEDKNNAQRSWSDNASPMPEDFMDKLKQRFASNLM